MPTLDAPRALQSSQRIWEQEIVPALYEYIRIPNKSPAYDARWQQNMDRAVALVEGWCRRQPLEGLAVEVIRLENRTPVILIEIPGAGYSFRTLKNAQALGDYRTLQAHGLPVTRIRLEGDPAKAVRDLIGGL